MPGFIDYFTKQKDLRRLRSLLLSDFIAPIQARTELFKLKFVDTEAMFRKHAEFGCDSSIYRVELKNTWVSLVAEDSVTGQIVFGTTFFLFHPGDPVTFWKSVPGSETFKQVPLSNREWYPGGNVFSIGYSLCSHSPAANVIETESIRKINAHFRKHISCYIAIFKKTVMRAAEVFDASLLIEPHGSFPIPIAFTFFPTVNVNGTSGGPLGCTREESMITEHICRRDFKIPLRKDVNGLHTLSSVYFGKSGSASITERQH